MYVVISAALIGVVLGHFFKTLILLPAFIVTGGLVLGAGMAHSEPASFVVLALVVAAIALQLGYLVGAASLLFADQWSLPLQSTRQTRHRERPIAPVPD
jgi:hypothetical protein